ncbi:hypothetical protein U1Q18_011930 [Sarracenia purpurea var. burkii]
MARAEMEIKMLIIYVAPLMVLGFCLVSVASMDKYVRRKSYIIHMAKHDMPENFDDPTHWYDSSLNSVSDSAAMLYTYNNVLHGFSARLTPEEARSLGNQLGVLSVVPEVKYELHTTRTPEFLGLEKIWLPQSNSVSEVIVGVLDTGVWPERKSFGDAGLQPVPFNWTGKCESGTNFTSTNCNRKLIGARFFYKGYEAAMGPIDESTESKSPRDDDGHGTHTASTAAGSSVAGANLFRYAAGTARGMAEHARVAVYKVCWIGGCFSSDILAAMDKAIDDNVNVLSMSLGGATTDYYRDSIAIGAFAAMEKGILVSCSAGNTGPIPYSVSNVAPWITTVGAGTLDRDFPAYVKLGNGFNFSGVSLYAGKPLPTKMLPLVYAGNASNSTNGNLCMMGTLIPEKVRGKMVLCDRGVNARVEKGAVVKAAGGAGMVLANTAANGEELVADAFLLPAAAVGQKSGDAIRSYLFSHQYSTATIIFNGTKVGVEPSPVVAAFSSRGPNPITPEILKPDVIAPGVNIIAAWTGKTGPTGLAIDKRRVEFNIISGTSMSCPHVSGLAALLKAAHPQWSPAAIRSALMTTAYTAYKNGQTILDVATGNPSTPFDYGAGHVDPVPALYPGLVYDLEINDYLDFLCALNYTSRQISIISRKKFECDRRKKYSVTDLNYPSFSVYIETEATKIGGGGNSAGNGSTVVMYSRTLTNVGWPATYEVLVELESESVTVLVVPKSLSFTEENQKQSYTVTFTADSMPSNSFCFGRIEWSDGKHIVGSPIAISWT